ncbi:hypothetical protein [Flavobacterium sp. GNP001]
MKKMIFTALAVVAFSGAAIANTGEDKTKKVVADDCQTKAMNYIDNDFDKDGTHTATEVHDAYQAYLAGCYSKPKEAAIAAN